MSTGLEQFLQEQEDSQDVTTPETPETTGSEEPQETSESSNEEVKTETPSAEEATPPTEEPAAIPPDNTELNELRQFIRDQKREISLMKAKLSRMKDGEVDDEGNRVVQYSDLEKLQIELHNLAVQRAPVLEVLVEAMEANPKYSDIYEVCTKANFDDMFEAAALNISRRDNRDYNEVLVQLELDVWKRANPYKYMYNLIKEHHPKFKGKVAEATKPSAVEPKPPLTAAKALEAKKAPGSIAAVAGGDQGTSNVWTAARIDAMDEDDLHTVPKEVYAKYMSGKLK